MNASTITKTLKKINEQPNEYSLGFKRLISLPTRVRKDINLACAMQGASNDNFAKEYLQNLSEIEYINFLIIS